MGTAPRAASEIFPQPPIFHLLARAEKLSGNHTNHVWRGQVGTFDGSGRASPTIVKLLDGQIPICIELACGLAAQALSLPVPVPSLVIADRSDLPDLPTRYKGDLLLLLGSSYKTPDALFVQVLADNPAAEELVWSKLCDSPTGSQGAVWDELVANADRHAENALFDGNKWWLFDHDLALPPAIDYVKSHANQFARQEAKSFAAKFNQLATQMVARYPNSHELDKRETELRRKRHDLMLMSAVARGWTHADSTINGILALTSVLLGLIELRLPATAQLIARRTDRPSANDLWTSPSRNSKDPR